MLFVKIMKKSKFIHMIPCLLKKHLLGIMLQYSSSQFLIRINVDMLRHLKFRIDIKIKTKN